MDYNEEIKQEKHVSWVWTTICALEGLFLHCEPV